MLKSSLDFIEGNFQFLQLHCLRLMPVKIMNLIKQENEDPPTNHFLPAHQQKMTTSPQSSKNSKFPPYDARCNFVWDKSGWFFWLLLFVLLLVCSNQQALLLFGDSPIQNFWQHQTNPTEWPGTDSLHLSFVLLTLMQPKIRSYLSIGRDHEFLNRNGGQFSTVQEQIWLHLILRNSWILGKIMPRGIFDLGWQW